MLALLDRIRGRSRAQDDALAAQRLAFINGYPFPMSVRWRLANAYPQLTDAQRELALDALRQWFRLHVHARGAQLAMPSLIVDQIWHDFMLHTQEYADFCSRAFGHFLHHTPESARAGGPSPRARADEQARTVHLAYRDQGPGGGLPPLFAVDRQLGIPGATTFLASCGTRHCTAVAGLVCLQHAQAAKSGSAGSATSCGGSAGTYGGSYDGSPGGGTGRRPPRRSSNRCTENPSSTGSRPRPVISSGQRRRTCPHRAAIELIARELSAQ